MNGQIQAVWLQTQASRNRTRFTFCRISALRRKVVFGFTELGNVLCAWRLFHRQAQLLNTRQLFIDIASRKNVRNCRVLFARTRNLWVLWQVAKRSLAQNLSAMWLNCPTKHLEQAGLASAVATNNAHLVAWHHRERCVFYNETAANFNRNSLNLEHPFRVSPCEAYHNLRGLLELLQLLDFARR